MNERVSKLRLILLFSLLMICAGINAGQNMNELSYPHDKFVSAKSRTIIFGNFIVYGTGYNFDLSDSSDTLVMIKEHLLGIATVPDPATIDINNDGIVNIADIVSAINQPALTPTPTPSATPTLTPTPSPSPTPEGMYCAGITTPVVIPDNDTTGVLSEIIVEETTDTVQSLRVMVEIHHTYVGDIKLTLLHEDSGTSVVLLDRPGYPENEYGCGASDLNIIFDDSAALPAEDECTTGTPGINGAFKPVQSLSVFDGESVSGRWILNVSDLSERDYGTLNMYCIRNTIPEITDSDRKSR